MDGEGGEFFGYVKRHPYVIAAVVVGFVLLLFMLRRGSSSAVAASTGIDPSLVGLYQSQAAQQGQQAQLSAQLQATQIAAGAQNFSTELAGYTTLYSKYFDLVGGMHATDQAATVQEAGIQAQKDIAGQQATVQIQQSHDSLTATQTGIEATLAGLLSTNASNVQLAGIQADEQKAIATTTASTAQTEIATLGNVLTEQTRSNAQVETALIKNSGGGGGAGGFFGSFARGFFS